MSQQLQQIRTDLLDNPHKLQMGQLVRIKEDEDGTIGIISGLTYFSQVKLNDNDIIPPFRYQYEVLVISDRTWGTDYYEAHELELVTDEAGLADVEGQAA